MNIKGLVLGGQDRCKTIYFKEGFSFKTSELPIQDGCLVQREGERVTKAWGHSPKALLPTAGDGAMVQLVNARGADPCDPFNEVDKKELFSSASVRAAATEQHFKALNSNDRQVMSKLQLLVLGIAAFLFLCGGIAWTIKTIGERYVGT